jgi:hypothetical protein
MTSRILLLATAALVAAAAPVLSAQSLARRVTAESSPVNVVFPSRADACGDGRTYIGNVLGRDTFTGKMTDAGGGRYGRRECIHGPARVMATVIDGQVSRLRAYVGPLPEPAEGRTITATSDEARSWLSDLLAHADSRVASEAVLPLVLVDGEEPWPQLLAAARDDARPSAVRRSALTWLAMGTSARLGLSDARAETDDDELRSQVVFALSQRPKSESVPALIDLARTAKDANVRRQAIFWLGQTGDRRAVDVYAALLGLK